MATINITLALLIIHSIICNFTKITNKIRKINNIMIIAEIPVNEELKTIQRSTYKSPIIENLRENSLI